VEAQAIYNGVCAAAAALDPPLWSDQRFSTKPLAFATARYGPKMGNGRDQDREERRKDGRERQRHERGGARDRDTQRAVSPLRRQSARDDERDRARDREREKERERERQKGRERERAP